MADTKITALTAITTVDPAVDVLPIVDVSDTTMAASGTTKKITSNQILGAGGTATLASATITGAASAAGLSVTGSTIPTNGIYLPSANNLGFAYNSTLGMTLNSTGLGVGIAPVAYSDKSLTLYGSTTSELHLLTGNTGSLSSDGVSIGITSSNELLIFNREAAAIRFGTNNTDVMRIDSSGNVGVGLAPKSWLSSYKAIQLGYSTSLSSTTGTDFAGLSSNAYVDSVDSRWERIVSGYATQYYQNAGDGQHIWRIAGTAAADTAITWTNAMTLSAAGSLVLGAAAVATTATDGFLYIPGCAGTPTGTPTSQTGRVPLVVDTTNNKLYFYSGGSWVAAN